MNKCGVGVEEEVSTTSVAHAPNLHKSKKPKKQKE
jgi:hypothetical protein